MPVSSRNECLELLQRFSTPEHIRRHSLLVAEVALFLAARLNGNGCRLDPSLIEAASLLHDIGKIHSIETGEDHAVLGATMLDGTVAPAIADIVRDHISLDRSQVAGPITESLLVNYSDKRVRHDQVVSIEERYEDLIARYAKSFSHEQFLRKRLDLYVELEQTIFSHLSIVPRGPEIMGIRLTSSKEYDLR